MTAKTKLTTLTVVCVLGFLILTANAFAAATTTLGLDTSSPGALITSIYVLAMGLVGITALIMLIFGGFMYLTAGDNEGRLKEARDKMTNAVLGLALALTSWMILNTINPDLLKELDITAALQPFEIYPTDSQLKQYSCANTTSDYIFCSGQIYYDTPNCNNECSGGQSCVNTADCT